MNTGRWVYVLLVLSLLIGVLPGAVLGAEGNHSPTMIIPTKFQYLLQDMIEEQEKPVISPTNPPPPTQKPITSTSPVRMESSVTDEDILVAKGVPASSSGGLGRGYVETNFGVSVEEPGRKMRDSQRLTARGLFDVHVSHGFN